MQTIFFSLPWPVTILVITLLVTGSFVLMRSVLHRTIKPEQIRSSHDVSGAVYAIIGVVYGIVLGLITVQGQERWLNLRDAGEKESSIIISIGHLAHSLPPTPAKKINMALHNYAHAVAITEWDDDRTASPEAAEAMREVLNSLNVGDSESTKNLMVMQTIQQLSADLIEARIARLSLIEEHIGNVLWFILIGGGFVTVGFLLWFAPLNSLLHTAMIAIVAFVTTSVLFLVFAYEHPTDGPLQILPDAYTSAAHIVRNNANEF